MGAGTGESGSKGLAESAGGATSPGERKGLCIIPRDSACLALRLRLSRPFPIAALSPTRSGLRSKYIDDTSVNSSSAWMVGNPDITLFPGGHNPEMMAKWLS
jgi:hypothetical protein